MRRLRERIKAVPWWGWVFGIVYFVLQYSIYRLGELLSRVLGTVSYAFECKIPWLDDLFPLVPIFAVIYLFSYVFWIFGPVAVSLTKRRNFINYIVGLSLAYLVGFLFFVFLPTCMDRVKEGLIVAAEGPGFSHMLLRTIYGADGGNIAFNLFPSYHCLISAYCYLGVRGQPEISRGFRGVFAGDGGAHLPVHAVHEAALHHRCVRRRRHRRGLLGADEPARSRRAKGTMNPFYKITNRGNDRASLPRFFAVRQPRERTEVIS